MTKILNPDYEICLCRHIKTAEVIEIIKDKKISCLKELCDIAGVGDKCGGCREELAALLEYVLENEKALV